jgi:hypothetical protein
MSSFNCENPSLIFLQKSAARKEEEKSRKKKKEEEERSPSESLGPSPFRSPPSYRFLLRTDEHPSTPRTPPGGCDGQALLLPSYKIPSL